MIINTDKTNFYKFILLMISLLIVILINGSPSFSKSINIEIDLALKYCDSLEKKLFIGLENEKILKYKYFFNSTTGKKEISSKNLLGNFESEVKKTCQHILTDSEKEEFLNFLEKYSTNNI